MRDIKELMIAFDHGDHINDDELEHMRRRLTAAETGLTILGYERYTLTLLDIRLKLDAVVSYQRARKKR